MAKFHLEQTLISAPGRIWRWNRHRWSMWIWRRQLIRKCIMSPPRGRNPPPCTQRISLEKCKSRLLQEQMKRCPHVSITSPVFHISAPNSNETGSQAPNWTAVLIVICWQSNLKHNKNVVQPMLTKSRGLLQNLRKYQTNKPPPQADWDPRGIKWKSWTPCNATQECQVKL